MYLGGPVPRDIYQRIKKLEDKILELEGISPEYFQSVVSISVFKKKICYFRILLSYNNSLIDLLCAKNCFNSSVMNEHSSE